MNPTDHQKASAAACETPFSDVDEASWGAQAGVLRTWKRRLLGARREPLPSGHTRHDDADETRSRLVYTLVAQGENPNELMDLPLGELELLTSEASVRSKCGAAPLDFDLDAVICALEGEEAAGFSTKLFEISIGRDAGQFVDRVLEPLLTEIGARRSQGDLSIAQEHLATSAIESLLLKLKTNAEATPATVPARTPVKVLLAGLPGSRHDLPLQMLSYVVELAGARSIELDVDSPVEAIVRAASLAQADIVGIHASCSQGPDSKGLDEAETFLAELRADLPDSVHVVLSGIGAQRFGEIPGGVLRLGSVAEFESLVAGSIAG